MGSTDSKCAELLDRLGWPQPPLADEFHHSGLVHYLQGTSLEVVLPGHAPQNDYSMGDRKPQMYPRPNFCWEAYKMHLALIGPSTACKKQFVDFLPQMAHVFRGTPAKLAPGREAIPYHLFDEQLHRLVLWELPEISWKQHCEDYIRELGLLYIDCVFMLFSEKYTLSDIYCKLCVAMALHGIPFFVLCTQSEEDFDEKAMNRIRSSFQSNDVQVRMFNPSKPHLTLEPLIADFFKEISWNRTKGSNAERIKDCSETVLGQTVRLKDLEKKPELNGRCGVCIGYDKPQDRYIIRLINSGVETDVALRHINFSVLKPKLLGAMVRLKGLVSKPELNGRYAFVDEFLRENERYRVFVPDVPGQGQALALKSENLERVESVDMATPVVPVAAAAAAKPTPKAAPKAGSKAAPVQQGESTAPRATPAAPRPAAAAPATVPTAAPPTSAGSAAVNGGYPAKETPGHRTGGAFDKFTSKTTVSGPNAPDRQAKEKPVPSAPTVTSPSRTVESSAGLGGGGRGAGRAERRAAEEDDGDWSDLLPKMGSAQTEREDDLMSRIFAAEHEDQSDKDAGRGGHAAGLSNGRAGAAAPARDDDASRRPAVPNHGTPREVSLPTPTASSASPARRLQLSRKGLLAFRVWAVIGTQDVAEEVIDHLMDCGKTVFWVSAAGEGARFSSTAELNGDPNLPRAEVLAFVVQDPSAVRVALPDAIRLNVRGIILHPTANGFGEEVVKECQAAGIVVHEANISEDVEPGGGIAVAPLD